MNIVQNLIIHHTAVSREKNPAQFDAVNAYHAMKGWGKIGYHYLIEANGEVRKGRDEKESGAHTSQMLMNFRSLGICLTGDFDKEDPTPEQIVALRNLIAEIRTRYTVPDSKIVPHRRYAPKTCWGSRLPDDIIKYIAPVPTVSPWAVEAVEKAKKKGMVVWENPQEIVCTPTAEDMFKKLGIIGSDTDKGITKERLAVILDILGLLK